MEVAGLPRLVVSPHPILAAAGREIHTAEFMPGESIEDYLNRMGVRLGRQPWRLEVNGQPVAREWWGRVRPKPGTLITLRALVHNGGGGGKNPLKTVLSIALMVAAPGLGTALGNAMGMTGTAFSVFGQAVSWGSVLGMGVSIAGNLLINALIPAPQPKLSQVNGSYNEEQVSPTYALTGGANRARPFEPLPLLMGRHIIYPDDGAKEYTEFEGDDQYLYQIFNFGIGTTADLQLTDFKIGDTPIANYSDVEIFEAGPDGTLPQMPGNVDSIAGGALTAAAGWITRTSSIDATALAFDLQGQLYRAGESGLESLSCRIEVEHRQVGDATWSLWLDETITSASRRPIRRTWRKNVDAGQYEVRARRVTADETDARNVSEFSWSTLRTYQPDTADYSGQRRVGLRIKASGQLQGQVEAFNAVGQRLVPVWHDDTQEWISEATDNPAWLYLWFSRGGSIAGRLVFGVGLADSRIDIAGLKAWGAFCAAEGLSFNAVFDAQRSRADMLDTIARCGRASPSWATGKLGVVWDAADQPAVGVYGMSNIAAGSFKVMYATEKLADEVVLTFFNRDTWKQDHVRATVPGFAPDYVPQRPVNVQLFGCTDKAMAGVEANLLAASQRYHRRRVQWESDFEALVAQRGDVVLLSHDLTQWGSSGRLVSATATTLTFDRAVSYSAGSPYVGVRHPDGTYHVRAVQAFTGEQDTVTLLAPLTFTDGETTYHCGNDPQGTVFDYVYFFEPLATPGKRVKIVGVPSIKDGGARVRLEACDDDPGYYASKANPYTWTPPAAGQDALPVISNLQITEELVRVGSGYGVNLHLTWEAVPAGDYSVLTSVDGEPLRLVGGGSNASSHTVPAPDTGEITVRVILHDGVGRTDPVGGMAQVVHPIAGKGLPPADLADFAVTVQDDGLLLSWPEIADPDRDFYEIRTADSGWGDAAYFARVKASQLRLTTVAAGTHTWYIRARDTSENYSLNSRSAQVTVTAPSATIVRAEVVDNNVLLSWDAVAGTFPTRTYEIRRGATHAGAEVVGTKAGLFTILFETTGGAFTYWVTAIDAAGNEGTPAAVSVMVNAPPDYVLKANYFSLFTGTLSNAMLDGARVVLPVDTTGTFDDHFTGNGWATPQDQVAAGYPLYIQPGLASGYYEETFDYGAVLAANKISVATVLAVLVGTATHQVDISVSADGIDWTAYSDTAQVYATNFRYVKVRITVAAVAGAVAELTSLNVRLDSKLKTIAGTLACDAADSGGTTLYLTDDRTAGGAKEFIDVDAILLTVAGTTPLTPIYDFTDAPNPLSLKVLLFTDAGARASGTVSYSVRGF